MAGRVSAGSGRWGTVAPGTHWREGEAGHNVLLGGKAGDTSQGVWYFETCAVAIEVANRINAIPAECEVAGRMATEQHSYAPEVKTDSFWLAVGERGNRKPPVTEEPDERIVHVRVCGGGGG
jgi:hypothetical protein